jgi:hypothetical protein
MLVSAIRFAAPKSADQVGQDIDLAEFRRDLFDEFCRPRFVAHIDLLEQHLRFGKSLVELLI